MKQCHKGVSVHLRHLKTDLAAYPESVTELEGRELHVLTVASSSDFCF